MQYRELEKTGMKVSVLALECPWLEIGDYRGVVGAILTAVGIA